MSVQILEGPTKYVTQCHNCSAILSYEKEDVEETINLNPDSPTHVIPCPHCKNETGVHSNPIYRVTMESYKKDPAKAKEKMKYIE
jgi:ribosomal protein S27E